MLLFLALGCGSKSEPQLQELGGKALGTTWSVKWIGQPDDDVAADVVVALRTVDEQMSTWRDDSEISKVRATPGPVPVSDATADVVRDALDLARVTGGAFDPTVQPLVEFWGFHGEVRTTMPSDEELAAVRERVGWQKVVLAGEAGRYTVAAGGTALDLSAIAKGHAVDEVSAVLGRHGHRDHMVEIGGEVRVRGDRSGAGWKVGVEKPAASPTAAPELEALLALSDRSMATSGNYRNLYEIDGQRVVHILDPRTGRPARGAVASATVLAPDCRTADGWATALMVLGEDGLELLPDGVDGYLMVIDGEGYRNVVTEGVLSVLSD